MPPIRNSSVARGETVATGYVTLYTVPASTVLLLKDVRLFNIGTATQNVTLLIQGPGGTPVLITTVLSITTNGYQSWSGWIALNAGDQVLLYCAAAGIRYWLSGALLPFVPGF